MRLLLLTPGYPPLHGGGEAYAHDLAVELARRGHAVTVVTTALARPDQYWAGTAKGVQRSESMMAGVRVIRLPVRRAPLGRGGQLLLRKAMAVISAFGPGTRDLLLTCSTVFPPITGLEGALASLPAPDIIHSFNLSWEHCIIAGQRLAQRADIPHVISPFMHVGAAGQSRVWRNNSMAHQVQALLSAAAILPLTDTEHDGLARFGISADRLHTVGAAMPIGANGRDMPPDPDLLARLGHSKAPIILFLGRADRDKGALLAMQAVALLHRQGVRCQLALAGAPSQEAERMAHALVRRGAPIQLLGATDEGAKRWLLAHCAALVLPSCVESFGLVLLEAWQHGKPVIAANVGGLRDVVQDEVTGLHVPWGDAPALAAAIQRLLCDPALADRLGAAGQDRAQTQYTWPAVAERVEAAYRLALAAHQTGDRSGGSR